MTKTQRTRTAAVIGGGIAGTVTAIALREAGIEADVYEAYDYSADGVGAYLTVQVNGLAVLRELDLLRAIDGLGFDTPRFTFHSGAGKLLGSMDTTGSRGDGLVTRTIRRAELYQALRDEAGRRGVRIHYGKRLASYGDRPESYKDTEHADRATARFTDGTAAEADVLVGADGLLSRMRTLIDPGAPRPRYVPLLNTGGYAGIDVGAEPGTMHMVFGREAFFCYMAAPGGQTWWFANVPQQAELTPAQLAVANEGWRDRLLRTFAPDRVPATTIIQATGDILAPWNTYDFPRVPHWHRDRMIVIGDAAHATSPTSGQGASMAMEDALVLAQALRDHPVPEAFTRYEAARRDRVEKIVADGNKKSGEKMPGPVGRIVRDAMLPLVFRREARKPSTAWVVDHRIAWGATV